MGTYLSTPVKEKSEESGESLECPDVPCAWGVVEMQGWRKSMEDAHTAVTDIALPNPGTGEGDSTASFSSTAKVFGVFDGHGGPEVARFCQLYLVSVLQKQPSWLDAPLPTSPDTTSLPNPDDREACAETPVGKALRSSFHALDRMISDPARRCVFVTSRMFAIADNHCISFSPVDGCIP
jgi:serine/threonine protein phosphatase PrpC